uniref:Uncharacterized protein n=1 Tax=Arundo donax TaxID=35708 RepID=A0A0A9GYC6_ARUDO
MFSSLSSS